MADIISNESPLVSQSLLIDRLNKENAFSIDGSPGFEEFKQLSVLCNEKNFEYGMQFNLLGDGSVKTILNTGGKDNISNPGNFYRGLKVFFHAHPEVEARSDKSVIAMAPSYVHNFHNQFLIGDIDGSTRDMYAGKYLNIINSEGVTFMIGREKHSELAEKTNRIRKKFSVENETSRPFLFIKSGKYEGEVVDEWTPEAQTTDHLGENDYLLFTVRVPYEKEDYDMLFVTHKKLQELNVTPDEICFKSGVNKIVDALDVKTPHSENLVTAMHSYCRDASI